MTTQTTKAAIEDVLALSPLQAGLFSLSEMAGDGLDVYSMQFVVEISGPLDADVLQRSVDALLARHPNLRVSLWDQGVPHPVQIVPAQVSVPWRAVQTTPEAFDDLARAERMQRFDLRRGPALRVVLAALPGGRHRMLLTAHHILMDGWAVALFFRELLAAYSAGGSVAGLAPAKPYRNYIAWLAQQDHDAALAEWTRYLDGVAPLLIGAPGTPAAEPIRHRRTIDAAETDRILGWARRHGLTPAAVTQYAWSVVLGRLADTDDVVFGTTISGRPQSLPGASEMVGLFINTVPVRADLRSTGTVLEAITAMQRSSAQMRDRGFLGLADIARAAGTPTLFDTLFVYENAPIGTATDPVTAADGTRFLPLAMESLAHYPLTVVAYETAGELVVMTESVPDALGAIDPAQLVDRVISVLAQLPAAADAPTGRLDVLLDHEKAWAAQPSRGSALPAGTTAIGLFLDQVAATPDAVALVADDGAWTYTELLRWSASLAADLRDAGVDRGSVVALAPRRSGRSIAGILAAMLAGAAYVPIDVAMPAARIENLLTQSGAEVVLTDPDSVEMFTGRTVIADWAVRDDVPREASAMATASRAPGDAAYLIFTSGSTGEPKGVVGTQGALASYARDHRDRVLSVGRERLSRPMRVAHAWTFSFDASWQPLAALLDGHEVHLFADAETRDAARLVAALGAREIDMIDTTPSMFGQLSAAGLVSGEPGRPTLTVLALGGEAIGPALWNQLGGLPRTAVFNCYGPTETTVEALVARVSASPVPTIAGATDRMTARVLDSRLRPVPDGVIGELYLTGDQVTRGYQGRPGQTAGAFVADPDRPGQRMYRTGDLVRRNAIGDILFVGRGDHQVKIRGYRIEVGEVEAGLRSVPGVRDAAVVVVDRPIGAALVGVVAGRDLDAATVREGLSYRLPAHMIPTRVLVLPVLPVNANGKTDAVVLGESAKAALAGGGASDEELDDVQERVADSVAGVLGARPGLDDDFFDLGMDSIVAMALVTALRTGGDEIAARDVMTFPTVRDLAAAVRRGERLSRIVADREYGVVPELPIVQWMYEGGDWRRFTQTVLFRLPDAVTDAQVTAVLQAVLDGHDMLRATRAGGALVTREPGVVDAASRFWTLDEPRTRGELVTLAARQANEAVDPDRGEMLAAVRIVEPGGDLLLLAIHHLAVDAVSWQILFADLVEAGAAVMHGSVPRPVHEYTDYRAWSRELLARTGSDEVSAQRDYWRSQVRADDPVIGARTPEIGRDTWADLCAAPVLTDTAVTARILDGVGQRIGLREFLLTALAVTFASWRAERGQDPAAGSLIALEGHGREDATVGDDVDTGRTLGWFTTVFPVRLAAGEVVTVDVVEADRDRGRALLESVAAELKAIPNRGLDYGLLRYADADPELIAGVDPQVEFNYLGRFDLGVADEEPGPWQPVVDLELNEHLPTDPEPDLPLRYALDIVAVVRATDDGPQLVTNWRHSAELLSPADIATLSTLWSRSVTALS
ncbi:amino acid adenylation domain-containing protein [Gordonia hydrophobica]|uniref:amino acid adenylation domain-containing protein n=1 Tax=Gordonia hydrophobica TaxID=40516 RepID=UPI000B29CC9E|nr:amino acid adenylation domain-containing protein [Gordonia hydrophobica]MBM7365452.1 mycobactin peptide synthetase MbtF [Gordonia hydrophobica]